jgi:hypothetical protein
MTVHMDWREDVACRDAHPDLFFPIGTTQGRAAPDGSETDLPRLSCANPMPGLGAGERGRRWRVGRHNARRPANHPEPIQTNDK